MRGRRAGIAALVVIALAAVGFAVYTQYQRGDEVLYQDTVSRGPSPFTEAAVVTAAQIGTPVPVDPVAAAKGQTFGGSGDIGRCDKTKLANFLAANPAKLAAWANVLGIEPTEAAVRAYIDTLVPTLLTRDVRVTNHGFKNGKAFALQSILQEGTAVLVDPKDGRIVVRCYCGNPLLPPKRVRGHCTGCPPNYTPPPSTCGPNECVETPSPTPTRSPGQPTPTPTPQKPTRTPRPSTFIPGVLTTPSPTPRLTLPPRPTPTKPPEPTPCNPQTAPQGCPKV